MLGRSQHRELTLATQLNAHQSARRLELFNTQPYMASFALGFALRLEDEIAAAGPRERVDLERNLGAMKKSLASALAALGDPLFWGALRPTALIVAVLSRPLAGIRPNRDTEALSEGVLHPSHVARFGAELFSYHLVSVEIGGTLLLGALVGAIAIVLQGKRAAVVPLGRQGDYPFQTGDERTLRRSTAWFWRSTGCW